MHTLSNDNFLFNNSSNILEDDLKRIYSSLSTLDKLNKKVVLITGCAGFLGFYFLQFLLNYANKLGIKKIIGLDNFLFGEPLWIKSLKKMYPRIFFLSQFNIAKDNLYEIPSIKKVNFVIHCASIASPTYYRKFPLETIDANIWGLRSLLNFYRDSKFLKGFLFFSSSEIYGDPDKHNIPTDENYAGNVLCTGPRSCYDESKRFGETLCWVYAQKYDMSITIARPFNNFGPGMSINDKRLPADLAKCILENKDIVIYSNGAPTRTFCYISDAIAGYLACLLYGKYNYFNIGSDSQEISITNFAKIFKKFGNEIFNYSGDIIYEISDDLEYMTNNPNRRCPNIGKARTLLNYNPQVSIEDGIKNYLSFIKQENI